MKHWITTIQQLAREESGVTSIEYALIGALIAAVCVLTVGLLGTNLNTLLTGVCNEVSTAVGGAGC